MKTDMRAVDYILMGLCWIGATAIALVMPKQPLWQIVGGILYSGLICLSIALLTRRPEMVPTGMVRRLAKKRPLALIAAWLLSAVAMSALVWLVWPRPDLMTIHVSLRWYFVLGTFLESSLFVPAWYLACVRRQDEQ